MEWGEFMPKKKKDLGKVLLSHAKEQCDGACESFVSMMSHYGMKGCLYVITPDNEQLIYCFSDDDSSETNMSILKSCSETTADYKNIILDNGEES
jgi:hypothetical protein